MNFDFIAEKLTKYKPLQQLHPDFTPSAVLILLQPTTTSYNLIMTVRSSKVHHHSGEISFPGGKFDAKMDKSLEGTALREVHEEIGIDPNNIQIMGSLDDIPTFTGFIIRPFIGLFKNEIPHDFIINTDEVAEILLVPIDFLLGKIPISEVKFPQYGLSNYVLSIDYIKPDNQKKYNLWGASAHMIAIFVKVIYDRVIYSTKYVRSTADEIVLAKKKMIEKKSSLKNKI